MSRMMTLVSVAMMAALAAVAPVRAQAPDFGSVALTIDSANRALDAMPRVHAVAQEYEDQFPDEGIDDNLTGLATVAAAQADLDEAVGAHGFSGYADWVATIATMFHAYAHVQSAGMMEQMGPAMEQAIAQIRDNPSIPEAQKEMMIEQMSGMSGVAQAMAENPPTPENEAVVRELGPRIEEVTRTMQESP